jgi:hypothetical protein
MSGEDERLLHEVERSVEEIEKMRKDDAPQPAHSGGEDDRAEGEPWAKTSSGDADSVTTDDD